MAEHYWTEKPGSEQKRQTIHAQIRGVGLSLTTDRGVFSKSQLDYGTRVLIGAVELPEAATAVDLGCGYGPVSAFLGRLYPDSRWTLIDVNERALALARENVAALSPRTQFVLSDGFQEVSDLVVDAVILNPPIRTGKQVIYRLFEESHMHLKFGGVLWIVIQKKQGAASAKAELEERFRSVDCVAKSGGYHVYRCVK
jgi:16S rRNA (guanine1207-N2)-methyltransferase